MEGILVPTSAGSGAGTFHSRGLPLPGARRAIYCTCPSSGYIGRGHLARTPLLQPHASTRQCHSHHPHYNEYSPFCALQDRPRPSVRPRSRECLFNRASSRPRASDNSAPVMPLRDIDWGDSRRWKWVTSLTRSAMGHAKV